MNTKTKQSFTLLLLIISISSFAQKRSYVQIGPAAYIDTKGSGGMLGGGLGAGSSKGSGGAGISIELLSQKKQLILPVYIDARFYFSPKTTSLYVTLQPGYNFRNDPPATEAYKTIKDKGGIYTGIGLGLFALYKKAPGLNVQVKYVFMQDKIINTYRSNTTLIIITNTHAGFISLCASLVI